MFTCPFCGHEIDGTTDDNYNRNHSKIKCPQCGQWLWADREFPYPVDFGRPADKQIKK